jgi:hypothetical protein
MSEDLLNEGSAAEKGESKFVTTTEASVGEEDNQLSNAVHGDTTDNDSPKPSSNLITSSALVLEATIFSGNKIELKELTRHEPSHGARQNQGSSPPPQGDTIEGPSAGVSSDSSQKDGSDQKSKIVAKLYMIEAPLNCTVKQLAEGCPALKTDFMADNFALFLKSHFKDAFSQMPTGVRDNLNANGDKLRPFFAKWSRHVTQSLDNWCIEERMRLRKPYDVDTLGDPREKRIPHTRYERDPSKCREYYLIEQIDKEGVMEVEEEDEDVHHALKECASIIPLQSSSDELFKGNSVS